MHAEFHKAAADVVRKLQRGDLASAAQSIKIGSEYMHRSAALAKLLAAVHDRTSEHGRGPTGV